MEVDLTVTVSVILGVAAVISPVLTSFVDNRYKLKLKRLELDAERFKTDNFRIIQYLENYLSSLLLVTNPDIRDFPNDLQDYQQAFARAIPYLPQEAYEWAVSLDFKALDNSSNREGIPVIRNKVREQIEDLRSQSIQTQSRWYKRLRARFSGRCNP